MPGPPFPYTSAPVEASRNSRSTTSTELTVQPLRCWASVVSSTSRPPMVYVATDSPASVDLSTVPIGVSVSSTTSSQGLAVLVPKFGPPGPSVTNVVALSTVADQGMSGDRSCQRLMKYCWGLLCAGVPNRYSSSIPSGTL